MKYIDSKTTPSTLLLIGCLWTLSIPASYAAASLIEFHQTGCQFLESEAKNHKFQPKSADDCEAINNETAKQRLKQAKPLKLSAGEYIFRVHNNNVPYELGFWLRGQGLSRLTLPSTSGGGIQTGGFKDYKITLETGKYYYSCPLNPTPDYTLIVTE